MHSFFVFTAACYIFPVNVQQTTIALGYLGAWEKPKHSVFSSIRKYGWFGFGRGFPAKYGRMLMQIKPCNKLSTDHYPLAVPDAPRGFKCVTYNIVDFAMIALYSPIGG